MIRKTPLYDRHLQLGGKMVEFAGFELPMQYSGVIAEHNAVRNSVGIFDVSHMGELLVSGLRAESALNAILTNDIVGMVDGKVKYSLLTNVSGGAVDDVLIYRERADKFWIVVNGANADKVAKWVAEHMPDDVFFSNRSEEVSQVALQGPKSEAILRKLLSDEFIPKKTYSFIPDVYMKGILCYISRTGYTAEDGFEIYTLNSLIEQLYDLLLDAGAEFGILPCGIGARDTLRLEGGMPLYGHELAEDIPINEVGLGFAIKMNKSNFIGKLALLEHDPKYARVGARVLDRGIAREHAKVFSGDTEVGEVTSGTHSPTLGYPICMLRIKREYIDKTLTVEVRGKLLRVEVVALPFYKCKENN